MNMQRRSLFRVALLVVVAVAGCTGVMAQAKRRDSLDRIGTIQSELDYLRSAKQRISIELTQVTLRQAFDGIAKKAALSITYEGVLNGAAKHDVSFTNRTLKDILGHLGDAFRLSYRTDGPDKLTIIGAIPKSG